MLMSELVTHASAEKCGDLLKVRKPTQGALHKGATLIIMVLFFLKHSTNLLWLGTSTPPEPSSRGKKRAAASDVDSDDAPSDDEKAHPITADVAMELKKTFLSLDEIYQILARSAFRRRISECLCLCLFFQRLFFELLHFVLKGA